MTNEELNQRVAELESRLGDLEKRLGTGASIDLLASKDERIRQLESREAEQGETLRLLREEVARLTTDKQQLQQKIDNLEASRVKPTPTQLVQSFRLAMNELQSSLEPQAEDRSGFTVDRFDVGLKAAVTVEETEETVRFELPALTDVVASEQLSSVNFTFSAVPKVEIADEQLVEVPVLLGQSRESALAALEGRGLTLGTETAKASRFAPGTVIDQNPEGGGLVHPATAVDITVSLGAIPSQVVVPDVVGLPQAEAQAGLVAAGLVVGPVTARGSTEPVGTVLSQNPAAGTQVVPGTPVALEVAALPRLTTVPQLLGLPESEALTLIETAELRLGSLEHAPDPSPPGIVREQDPGAGTSVVVQSAVSLVVTTSITTVPNLIGETVESAGEILGQALLEIGAIRPRDVPGQPFGIIVDQKPTAGAEATVGSAVDLTVSGNPPEPGT